LASSVAKNSKLSVLAHYGSISPIGAGVPWRLGMNNTVGGGTPEGEIFDSDSRSFRADA
jgi:hypothetical protein